MRASFNCRSVVLLSLFAFSVATVATADSPGPAARPEQVGMSSARLALLTSTLRAYAADERIPGAVALVMRRGRVVYHEPVGWRDREARAPMRADTLFRIASQTKAVVSVAVMMLQEDGKLLLTDPVHKFLPEFADTQVAAVRPTGGFDVVRSRRPITIRDLLTHTAGLGYGRGPAAEAWRAAGLQDWYFANHSEPMADVVSRMASLPFDAQPGERWVYGYSSDVLGVLIEKVTGQTLDLFLRQRIFAPLGMDDTRFYVPPAEKDRLAVVYAPESPRGLRRLPDGPGIQAQGEYVSDSGIAFSGGGGLVSTAGDYARFLQMLLAGGVLDGERILSRKSVELMIADHLAGIAFRPGERFGLGFSLVTDVGERGTLGSVGEFAWGGAYHTTYWVDPREQLVVVYLTQILPVGAIDDYGKVRALIYQAIID
jgi:CubicO group peptidase (beta-lactamase class C family)